MKTKILTFLAILGLSINTFGGSSMTPSVVDLPIVVTQVSNLTVEVSKKVDTNDLASTTLGSEGIRRVGALGGYTLEEFIEDTALRGPSRDYTTFTYNQYPVVDLIVTNLGGDVYSPEQGYFHLDAGTAVLKDNSVNYAYWNATPPNNIVKWTTTRPTVDSNIVLGVFVTAFGSILEVDSPEAAGDFPLNTRAGASQIAPSLVVNGLEYSATGTALSNVVMSGGVEYHDMRTRKEHSTLNLGSAGVSLIAFGHTNLSTWVSIVTNVLPIGKWDNGSNIVECNPTNWYKGLFLALQGSQKMLYIYPQAEYTNSTDAIAGFDPSVPPGFTPYIPMCTEYVFQGSDTVLRVESQYWVDRRFQIRRPGTSSTVSGGGAIPTPSLDLVLLKGADTGGILPYNAGDPTLPSQLASKHYVDSTINNIYANPVFSSSLFMLTNSATAKFSIEDIPAGTTNTYILPADGGILATYTDIQIVPVSVVVGEVGGIAKGRVVYQSGSVGGRPQVKYASSDEHGNLPVIGVTSSSGDLDEIIEVVQFGPLKNIDTSAFSANGSMYLGTNGMLMGQSSSPNDAIILMGTCLTSNSTTGSMLVNIRSYYQDGAFAGSMRYAIQNASSASNASANFFALNELDEAIRMGIRSTNHFLGQGAYLVSGANGKYVFGNLRRQGYVWNIDMTDSANIFAHNNWPMMSLIPQVATSNAFLGIGTTNPLAMLDVRGNVIAQQIASTNSFRLSNNGYSTNEHITYGTTTNLIGILNTNLQGQISNNSNITYNANTNLSARINTETNRAIQAEGVLDGKINTSSNTFYTIATNLQGQINIETNRAFVAETNLSNRINIETNRAIIAEGALDSKINTASNTLYSADTNLSARINTETNRAITAENGLTNSIVANYTNLNNAINTTSNTLSSVDTNLSARINTETNRAYVAETNLQSQVTSATNRIAIIEAQTNALSPSTKFFANMGTIVQTFGSGTTDKVQFTNTVQNVGGIYSNKVFRWIPGVSNVMVHIAGNLNVDMGNNSLVSIYVYKNGTNKCTVFSKRTTNVGEELANSFTFVDITTNAADYYEIHGNVAGGGAQLNGNNGNWWSGQIVR